MDLSYIGYFLFINEFLPPIIHFSAFCQTLRLSWAGKKDWRWDGLPRFRVDAGSEGLELPSHPPSFPLTLVFAPASSGQEFGGGFCEGSARYAPMQRVAVNYTMRPSLCPLGWAFASLWLSN